jgi:hypothetical protein
VFYNAENETPFFWMMRRVFGVFFVRTPLLFLEMHSHIYHFFALAILGLLVHANPIPVIRNGDVESVETTIGGILDNSTNFSAIAEAVLMPRIEEWLAQNPISPGFSTITNSTSVFATLADYVVESERGLIPRFPVK